MKVDAAFFKSTKGILLTTTLVFFLFVVILASTIFYFVKSSGLIGSGSSSSSSRHATTIPLSVWKKLLESNDEKTTAHLFRGEMAFIKAEAAASARQYTDAHNHFEEADDELQQALGIDAITCVFLQRHAEFEYDFGHYDLAEAIQRKVVRHYSAAHVEPFLELRAKQELIRYLLHGAKAKRDEAVKLAQDNLQLARQIDAEDTHKHGRRLSRALDWLAFAYRRSGDDEQSFATYQERIECAKNIPHAEEDMADALNNQAYIRLRQEKLSEAEKLFGSAIAADPSFEGAYDGRASLRSRQKNYDGAIADYTELVKIDPKSTEYLRNRAFAYMDKGDLDNALSDAKKAVETGPKNPDNLKLISLVYEKSGDLDAAVKNISVAIENNPELVFTWQARAELYARHERYVEAIGDYTSLLAKLPSAFPFLSSRAAIYEKQKNYDRAIADYSLMLEKTRNRKIDCMTPNAARGICIETLRKRAADYKIIGKDSLAAADLAEAESMQKKIQKSKNKAIYTTQGSKPE